MAYMKNTFMKIKKIIGRDILLSYPNFNGRIIIPIYAIKMQIVRVISGK